MSDQRPQFDRVADAVAAEVQALIEELARTVAEVNPPWWRRIGRRSLAQQWASMTPDEREALRRRMGEQAFAQAQREAEAEMARYWGIAPYLRAYQTWEGER